MILYGCRWFTVLVVTGISQHTEELFLYCTHECTWLIEVILFFYLKQDSKKKIIIVSSPSRLKINDYFLKSIVLFPILLFPTLYSSSDKKTSFKKNTVKNTWSIVNYLIRGVFAGGVWNFFKSREVILSHRETGRIEPKRGDLPSDGERRQVCKIVRCFQPQPKIIYCYKKECVIS